MILWSQRNVWAGQSRFNLPELRDRYGVFVSGEQLSARGHASAQEGLHAGRLDKSAPNCAKTRRRW
jgi:hypothetical protein